jgi:hypothetical protein
MRILLLTVACVVAGPGLARPVPSAYPSDSAVPPRALAQQSEQDLRKRSSPRQQSLPEPRPMRQIAPAAREPGSAGPRRSAPRSRIQRPAAGAPAPQPDARQIERARADEERSQAVQRGASSAGRNR